MKKAKQRIRVSLVRKLVLRLFKAAYIILDNRREHSPEEIEKAFREMSWALEQLGIKEK